MKWTSMKPAMIGVAAAALALILSIAVIEPIGFRETDRIEVLPWGLTAVETTRACLVAIAALVATLATHRMGGRDSSGARRRISSATADKTGRVVAPGP